MLQELELAKKVVAEYDKEDAPLFEGIGEVNGNTVALLLAWQVIHLTKVIAKLEKED